MKTHNLKLCFAAFVLVTATFFIGCNTSPEMKGDEPILLIETDMGDIKVKLYNETPKHRDNFIKLAEEGFFDGVTFHRVIENFMIQGGDPTTKENPSDTIDDAGYTIDAEFVKGLYHKKGALAAARLGDAENPEKKSSGSQFYIVQGKVFTPDELNVVIERKNKNQRNNLINNMLMKEADKIMDKGGNPDFTELYKQMQDTIQAVLSTVKPYQLSQNQIDTYTTVGGTPHLDDDYTVFGEVIEGLEVIDKIAATKTDATDRPVEHIRMKVKVLKK